METAKVNDATRPGHAGRLLCRIPSHPDQRGQMLHFYLQNAS